MKRNHIIGFAVIVFVGAVVLIAYFTRGRGRGRASLNPAPGPFEMKVHAVEHDDTGAPPEPPKVEIIAPDPNTVLDAGKPVTCRVRLVIPERGRLPTFVKVYYLRDGRDYGSHPRAVPKRREPDGSYLLETEELTAPDQPGAYSMIAETTDVQNRKSKDDPYVVTTDRIIRTKSPPVPVVVR